MEFTVTTVKGNLSWVEYTWNVKCFPNVNPSLIHFKDWFYKYIILKLFLNYFIVLFGM